MLWSGVTGGAAFVAASLLGLGIGGEADVMPFLVSRYFGMRSMGELFGCVSGSYTLGVAIGPYLFSAGFDWTGSYRLPLACALGGLLLAIAATLQFGEYQRHQIADPELRLAAADQTP